MPGKETLVRCFKEFARAQPHVALETALRLVLLAEEVQAAQHKPEAISEAEAINEAKEAIIEGPSAELQEAGLIQQEPLLEAKEADLFGFAEIQSPFVKATRYLRETIATVEKAPDVTPAILPLLGQLVETVIASGQLFSTQQFASLKNMVITTVLTRAKRGEIGTKLGDNYYFTPDEVKKTQKSTRGRHRSGIISHTLTPYNR